MAHYHLWRRDGGEYHIADRLLQAVAADPSASSSHEQTARRYQLYTEIFADRGALWVTNDPNPVIAGLVTIDAQKRQINLEISASELKRCRAAWKAPRPRYSRGVLAKYASTVTSASLGAVTDLNLHTTGKGHGVL